jgi:endoglucanase
MYEPSRRAAALLTTFLSVVALPALADDPAPSPPPAARFVELSAHDQVRQMGRGVNVIGYDPFWRDGAQDNYKEEHFAEIKAAGFSTVRVVLFTFPALDARN